MKVNGREIADKLYGDLKERIKTLAKKKITPHLVVILVGEHPASVAYVTLKQKKGEEIGAKVTILNYPTSITTEKLAEKVKLLNQDPYVHGILIQRPLPEQVNERLLEMLTDPKKDIDGFHPKSPYTLPLPLAVEEILKEICRDIHSDRETPNSGFLFWLRLKNIILLGKGPTGGGPILEYFKTLKVKLHLIDSKTKNPEKLLQQADIIISAVGRKHVIKPENLKKGVILISVGINRGADKRLHGDYDEEAIQKIASFYTPTPGGVGPVNVAKLMDNLIT
ncbi:MAG: bifunctional 5,10-methylenetetrahydrofolate dehydrogenase/5,10-methenyltetrahydrofolate cyclohydrolase, partial [Acidobacteriota bacterium]